MAGVRESTPCEAKARSLTREQEIRRGIHRSGLPDGEIRLFMILLDKADYGSAVMQPKFAPRVAELVELCNRTRATVFRRLAHLERHFWVVQLGTERGPNAKIIRHLQIGERCECPPHGGNRRTDADDARTLTYDPCGSDTKASAPEREPPTPTPTPTPTPETVSSWHARESHLGTENSLILKYVSAGQPANSDYGAVAGKELWGGPERSTSLTQSPESWRSWPVGTIGYEENRET
jgi:hypothetical protein